MSQNAHDTLRKLQILQKAQTLKIIELNESLRAPDEAEKRDSGVSETPRDSPTPASLEADLTHYKELFSKLRFSYVEQMTKEKFLQAITDSDPPFIEHQQNVELEAQLAEAKSSLKSQKLEVASFIEELEKQARLLSERYDSIQLRTAELQMLPTEIAALEQSIEALRDSQAPHPTNPELSLPLPETQALLSQREAELASINAQLAALEPSVQRKARDLERLERELQPLETQKQGVISAAKEARRRREEGEKGMGDELEEKGRWFRAAEKGLMEMLEIEGCT
ncbi:hypothetical protein EJ05DRAFT_388142 [Pseudovirgaria hyperparasitica]|uniref:Kinetochore protein Sos7 coiled-coil domain-containing protein n=1 Tax=Pseudovirgaria hyperparasitica TaxID=470096 RepID=A0A6A6W5R9_9PEZI|nr:uncharacterized protein EJ05DRAFT_388142 [Pseudovirgaria hyperparasitica]KAF2757374.1 hypothetical protein EJ05DRAFT_388142 [Pseudovirgaria hyperparasitica]